MVTAVPVLLHSRYIGDKASEKPAASLFTLSRMEQTTDSYILLRNSERRSQFVILKLRGIIKKQFVMLCSILRLESSRAVMGKLRPAGQIRPPEMFYPARATLFLI